MEEKQAKIIDALKRYVKEESYGYFVVDMKKVEDKIIVTYLDGHTTEEEYVEHNFKNYYRTRMTNQIQKTLIPNMENQLNAILSKNRFDNSMLITNLLGMFITYGLDANDFFKILFTCGFTLSLLNRLLSDRRVIKQVRADANTLLPLITYGYDDDVFSYVDSDTRERKSLINVEDIYSGKESVESMLVLAIFASFVSDEEKKYIKDSGIRVIVRDDGTQIIQTANDTINLDSLDQEEIQNKEVHIGKSK